jgi:signal transduction histidine kinase
MVRITNPAFDRMFGHEPGALDGTAVSALLAGGSLRPAAAGRQAMAAPAEFLGRRGTENFVGAAVASALTIAGEPYDVYVVQDITERKELEREIIDISNREQQRIGSDLHDGLGQELTGVALMLRGLSSRMKRGTPAKVDEIEEIVGFVNQAIESARSLARGLAPVSLERGGLVYALRALATRAADQFGIDVRFRNRVRPALTLDGTGATHLYRIAQESITNAARHGRASNVQIQLNVNQQRVVLVITDDGSGLPEGALSAPGMGLKIMQYRARMLGGDVRVERMPEGGTRVICEVRQPLPEAADLQRELGGVRS